MPMPGSSSIPSTLEDQLCFALYSTLHAVGRAYAGLLPDLGLTYPQYLVMLVLWEEDQVGMKALGERLHLDSGTLTPLLKRMEQGGLLRRTRDADDERQVRVALAETGRMLRQKAECVPHRLGELMGSSPEWIGGLRDDLLRLRATLLNNPAGTDGSPPADRFRRRTSSRAERGRPRSSIRSA